MTTPAAGELVYYNGSSWVDLTTKTGQVLVSQGGQPTWTSIRADSQPEYFSVDLASGEHMIRTHGSNVFDATCERPIPVQVPWYETRSVSLAEGFTAGIGTMLLLAVVASKAKARTRAWTRAFTDMAPARTPTPEEDFDEKLEAWNREHGQ